MQFFLYTLADENIPQPPPTPELMAEMGEFVADARRSGALIATGGLAPTSQGVKVSLAHGAYKVTDGPFTEAKEIVGGWALIKVASKDEAIGWAKRFLKIVGGGESRIRQVFGSEDF